MSYRTDTDRLDWMAEHFASFGSVTLMEAKERPNGLPPAVVRADNVFVRVPCTLMYEWHCFDGEDVRAAIDAAMDGPRCAGVPGDCTARARLWEARALKWPFTAREQAEDGE